MGLLVMTCGARCFVWASSAATFGFFLFALVVMASGSTVLQTAAGPYVSLLGTEELAPSRFSLALGVNSLGVMLAPGFGAIFLLHDAQLSSASQATSLRLPYLGIAAGLFCMAFLMLRVQVQTIETSTFAGRSAITYRGLLAHPKLVFGVLAMFLYVGAEIAIGSLLINFLGQPDTLALRPQRASLLASLYGAGIMIGRFAAPLLLRKIRAQKLLSLAAAAAIVLIIVSILTSGALAAASLIAVGLCNSVMVPIIFTSSISGLGTLTGRGSGLLVAALVGGALIPLLQGVVADHIGLHASFLVPGACYLGVLGFGIYATDAASSIS